MTWADLEAAVRKALGAGQVTMRRAVRHAMGERRDAADLIAREVGYKPIGERWRAVERIEAERILAFVLQREMAHDSERMGPADASWLASEFLAQVGGDAQCFTNGVWGSAEPMGSWEPLSTATFDAGIVAVSESDAAILWIEDED